MAKHENRQSLRILAALFIAAGLISVVLLAAWAVMGRAPLPLGPAGHVTLWCFGALAGFAGSALLRARGDRAAVKAVLARVALLLVSVAIALGIGEWGLRRILARALDAGSFERFKELKAKGSPIHVHSASPLAAIIRPSADPKLVYELEPNLTTNFGGHRLVINADGQRDERVYPKERAPSSVRILGLGDSGIFGWGVEQGANYLDVAAKVLNARGDGVAYESINTGTPGYNTQLELELLRARGLAFHPDIVVVGWCENDFFLPHFFLKKNDLPKNRILLWDLLFHRDLFKHELKPEEIADRDTAKNSMGKVDMEHVPEEMKTGLYAEGVRGALAEMKKLSEEQGFKLLVFGPLKHDIRDIVESLGIDFVSTFDKIGLDQYPKEWAVHAMHPRAEGHRVLGELLAAELDQRGWLKPQH